MRTSMRTHKRALWTVAGCLLPVLGGCSQGSQSIHAAPASATGRGAVQINIRWPAIPQSRLVPAASQSIVVELHDTNGIKQTSATIQRPTTTVTIQNVTNGDYIEYAFAYPTAAATGTAQAIGSQQITVVADTVNKTPDLTMNTTITFVGITPTNPVAAVGGAPVTLSASATDKDGNNVLTAPANFKWTLQQTTAASLTPGGATASLLGLAKGTAVVSVKENESGVTSATVTASITASAQPPAPSNIFLADSGNRRIVGLDAFPPTRFTPYDDSASGTAFYSPQSVCLDAQGRIYVADYQPGNGKIVRVDDLTGKNRAVYAPPGSTASLVYVDKSGKIYFRDDNLKINRMDDMTGSGLISFAGSAGTPLGNPSGIAVDSKNRIHVFDGSNQIIRFDDMTGKNLITLGSHGNGTNQFNVNAGDGGGGIAIDSSDRIYIADSDNNRIVRIDNADTGANWTVFNIPPVAGSPVRPLTVEVSSGANPQIYFLDNLTSVLYRMDDMNGTNLIHNGAQGSGAGQFLYPTGFAVK